MQIPFFDNITKHHYVISLLVKKQLTLRYRRTVLGYFWAILNPLFSMLVLTFVFSTVFGQDPREFAVFLFSGMIAWSYFNASVIQCSDLFLANEQLIKKIYLPKELFPISIMVAMLIDAMLVFIAFFLIMLSLGAPISTSLFFLPVAYFILTIFILGVGLAVSIFTIFFRDLQHIIPIFLQALFFLTPIIYPEPKVPNSLLKTIFDLNPLSPFISMFRDPLMNGHITDWSNIISSSIFSIFSIVIGVYIFNKNKNNIIYRLN